MDEDMLPAARHLPDVCHAPLREVVAIELVGRELLEVRPEIEGRWLLGELVMRAASAITSPGTAAMAAQMTGPLLRRRA